METIMPPDKYQEMKKLFRNVTMNEYRLIGDIVPKKRLHK